MHKHHSLLTVACRASLLGLLMHVASGFADSTNLHAGPMQGYPAMRSAVIWLQTETAENASIAWWPQGHPELRIITPPITTEAQHQFTAHIEVTGLLPGTRYEYQAVVDGKSVNQPTSLSFTTLPLWPWRTPAPDFKVLTGSCAYINEPTFDRPGSYGGGYEIYTAMAQQHADLMLWMGDNLYFREADYASPQGMAARYWHDRALPALQPLLQNTPQVAMWDDHDYGYNDSGSSFIFKDSALALFKDYWANPSYGQPDSSGTFTKVTLNDADFFMLDDRWWRDADLAQPDVNKKMFGDLQMRWLKNALLESAARYRIIVAGGQMLNNGDKYEGWNHYPYEQQEFLTWLVANQIPGVMFLSGDRHITELLKLDRTATYPLIEFTCSPLNSGSAKGAPNNTQRIDGTLVEQRNFCRMDFSGKGDARTLTLRVYDTQGAALWHHELGCKDMGLCNKPPTALSNAAK